MPSAARQRATEKPGYTHWDRARLSVVVPIGVIVAVAIVCIVVAVLSSTQRADEVAVVQESHLFTKAIAYRGEWSLRKLESVAEANDYRGGRPDFAPASLQNLTTAWLKTLLDHEYVFVVDTSNRVAYSRLGDTGAALHAIDNMIPDLAPAVDYLRRPSIEEEPSAAVRIFDPDQTRVPGRFDRVMLVQRFLDKPALVTAIRLAAPEQLRVPAASATVPIAVAVKFIDAEFLVDIASRLQLPNLRIYKSDAAATTDHIYVAADKHGQDIMRLAWTPKQPGAEIVNSVVPFIAVALAGFALLAAFVLRYMRRTAAAIAAGETRLRHLAMHDPLCGLPNRIFFGERLEAVIDEVQAGSSPAAVFYIDLDHFKDVNDTLGHPVGDELIRNVTLRLSRTLRGGDLVARLGGDEFAVISSIGDDTEKMLMIAHRIIAALCAPYSIGGQNIVIGASIGIAVIERNCAGAADIMRYADMALYRAKNEGRNRACIYDAAMDADLFSRKLLEADLREAIEHDRLQLLYQPIVNKSGEKVVGVEALCRWTHPTRGEIEPTEFIAAAEHSGLIIELGAWVLRRACTDGNSWPGLTVSVNVSPMQFRRSDFVEVVERTLAETTFDPARLELELTENVLIGNVDTAEAGMARLKALGVRLALDDFGTGYSSLLYLRRLPFDKLKIDRSFVLAIEKAADAASIVHAVVSLGRGLGMKVTAEGVETADQQLFLRAAGVHFMQGYRFGKAVTAAEITARLQSPEAFQPYEPPQALAG
ncbi:MAG: bifunctional diguanylate cyclase/phosphodiesterase [Rhizobiales bacterium]|nr:bifunctional diguanylate cyclase/phosphodiesterase [Hyphomicrobiales bacterium]